MAITNRHVGLWLSDESMELRVRDREVKRNDKNLTFEALEDGTIAIVKNGAPTAVTCQYSTDGGENWKAYSIGTTLKVKKNDIVKFKCTTTTWSSSTANYYQFVIPNKMDVYGDILSLRYNSTSIPNYVYYKLFADCKIVHADLLKLTGATATIYGCTGMFMNCTELVSAPELPATTLNTYCYQQMFYGCVSLRKAPDLPAKGLQSNCYYQMFYGCGLIDGIRMLGSEYVSSSNVFTDWLKNVAPVGTLYKSSLLTTNMVPLIPAGWSVVNVDSEALSFTDIGQTRRLSNVSGATGISSFDMPDFFEVSSNGDVTLTASPSPISGSFSVIIKRDGQQDETRIVSYSVIRDALKFTATQANSSVGFGHGGTAFTTSNKFYYSLDDGGTWTEYASPSKTEHTSCAMISLPHVGDSVLFRGTGTTFSTSSTNFFQFRMTGRISVSGRIMSLLNYLGSIPSYCFYKMFFGCESIVSASGLFFINTNGMSGYTRMFENCVNLAEAPMLPTLTLANYCYAYMFQGCTSLTEAPVLPATTLKEGCYQMMFADTSLVIPPELPAMTLAVKCYYQMFRGCTELSRGMYLPATNLQNYCYQEMFQGCASLPTFPYLPATALKTACYAGMFQGCTNLHSTSVAFGTWTSGATENWLDGVSATGYIWKGNNALPDTRGVSNIPTGWNVHGTGISLPIDYVFNYYDSINLADYLTASGATVAVKGTLPSGLTLDGMTITGTITEDKEITVIYTVSNTTGERTFTLHPITVSDALKFTATQANSKIRFNKVGSPTAIACQYSLDNGGTWNTYTVTTASTELTLANIGDTVMFKCTSTALSSGTTNYYRFVMSAGQFDVTGSITSLCNFRQTCSASYQYYYLFYGCTRLRSARITFPHKLTSYALGAMFYGCTGLVEAPELPMTFLASYCYTYMFYNCTSLTTAPELPASTVPTYAYNCMFYNCKALVNPPSVLPSVTGLGTYCYYQMFRGCTSLTHPPVIKARQLQQYCFAYMFCDCHSLTEIPELPYMTLPNGCYEYMFVNCTSLTDEIYLPAVTLVSYAYYGMFIGCTGIKSVKMYASGWNISHHRDFLRDMSDNGCITLLHPSCTTIYDSAYGIPYNWYCRDRQGNKLAIGGRKTEEIGVVGDEQINYQLKVGHDDENDTVTFEGVNVPSGISVSSSGLIAGSCSEDASFNVNVLLNGKLEKSIKVYVNQNSVENCLKITNVNTTTSTVKVEKSGYPTLIHVQYSLDNGTTWGNFTFGTNVTIPKNGSVLIRNRDDFFNTSSEHYYRVTTGGKVHVSGDISSLLNFSRELRYRYALSRVFSNCGGTLLSSGGLVLPYQTMTYACYFNMFNGCSAMTDTPELPAMTLNAYCYQQMFYNCKTLTEIPDLPANVMKDGCYYGMFQYCIKLTSVPPLKATLLASACFQNMFYGCTGLTEAPELPMPIPVTATYCYASMFRECTNLVAPPPILPSEELATYCYQQMFYSCTKLASMPELPAKVAKQNCYNNMFYNCKALTETTHIRATNAVSTSHTSMFQGCSALNKITVDFSDLNSTIVAAMANWVNGVSATGTFIAPASMTVMTGTNAVPSGWTVKKQAKVGNNNFVFPTGASSFSVNCTCESSALTFTSPDIPPAFTLNANGTVVCNSMQEYQKYSFTVTATPADADLDPVTFQVYVTSRPDILRFTATQANSTIGFGAYSNTFSCENTFYYSLDEGETWTLYSNPANVKYTSCAMIAVPSVGDSVLFRGVGENFGRDDGYRLTFRMTGKFEVSGNVMSLINFADEMPSKFCFASLFHNCKSLVSAQNLSLPATKLTPHCYQSMFNSSGVVTPPVIPLAELADYCYYAMFSNDTALTTAPVIPSDDIRQGCYREMFYGCTNLVSSVELRSESLATECYQSMFYNCNKLTGITAHFGSWNPSGTTNCTLNWVYGISNNTGVFTIKSQTLTVEKGNNRIPSNWTIVRE